MVWLVGRLVGRLVGWFVAWSEEGDAQPACTTCTAHSGRHGRPSYRMQRERRWIQQSARPGDAQSEFRVTSVLMVGCRVFSADAAAISLASSPVKLDATACAHGSIGRCTCTRVQTRQCEGGGGADCEVANRGGDGGDCAAMGVAERVNKRLFFLAKIGQHAVAGAGEGQHIDGVGDGVGDDVNDRGW